MSDDIEDICGIILKHFSFQGSFVIQGVLQCPILKERLIIGILGPRQVA